MFRPERSVVGTAVASVSTVVHEPAVAVSTADASVSAPRSIIDTDVASVLTVVST